ncbi:MAG TPA: hypothetical protein VMN60_05200 [Longimicrobiales bacterium]|nr:hypothetical protein [Longimicrobiales bacterium]
MCSRCSGAAALSAARRRMPDLVLADVMMSGSTGSSCCGSCASTRAHVRCPSLTAQRLCPKVVVVPVPRGLCGEKSRAIRDLLERFTPVLEPASIDEAYLDMIGVQVARERLIARQGELRVLIRRFARDDEVRRRYGAEAISQGDDYAD